jgi:hypothetical protein
METVTSSSDSEISENHNEARKELPTWLKVGTVATASALAGGLAAVWFYRKTLLRHQNAETRLENSNFGISAEKTEDDE